MSTSDPSTLSPIPLPDGITSRYVDTSPHSLRFHVLEANAPPHGSHSSRPLILLVHGFPELAYSWRKMILPLASASYHVVAFDQRGYGRTTPNDPDLPSSSFRPLNLIRDVVILTHALGHRSIRCLVGHDFGAVTSSLVALARPDFVDSLVLMSHPFKGSAALPFNTANDSFALAPKLDMEADLAALPTPRKHYKWYYCTPPANDEMTNPTSSLHAFLRGYFHLKSADWSGNNPHPLTGWTASELAKMPRYYIMDKSSNMREGVAKDMSSEDPTTVSQKSARWLPDNELAVYTAEFARTGFQGGLNWYKVQTWPDVAADVEAFAGKKIEVPTLFVSGAKDWGSYQDPGALEAMDGKSCVDFREARFVEGAGHWLPQERPEEAVRCVLGLLESLPPKK